MRRRDFVQTIGGSAAAALARRSEAQPAAKSNIKLGVSFYSYQEEYYTRQMSLEDCFAEVADIGAEGVQIIAEEMVPNYPNPPQRWVDDWFRLMDKYHTKPTNIDTFLDVTWGGNRTFTLKESVDTLVAQMKLAHRLGYKVMRPTTGPVGEPAPEMIEAALPYAEELDVRICPEIHGNPLRGKFVDTYLDLITRTKTRYAGYTLDMGTFMKRPARVTTARSIRDGSLKQSTVDYVQKSFRDGVPREQVQETVAKMGDPAGARYVNSVYTPCQDPQNLVRILTHVYNIHGKFYEMTDELEEYSIPYADVIAVLVENGYEGYIDSEYEGQRQIQDITEVDSCEQVRRQHVMLRRILARYT